MKRLIVAVFGIIVVALTAPAQGRPLHHRQQVAAVQADSGCDFTNSGRVICGPAAATDANGGVVAIKRRDVLAAVDEGTIIGPRPEGCPHAYCGCGLRMYLGLSDKRLNLASNWARVFPRVAGPAAGVAAVRSGHVMYIEAAAGDGLWLVRDYNSGAGLSRLHVRDVRGYIFVDPRSPKA